MGENELKYKAFIDGEAELVGAKGKSARGFRFNAYLWIERGEDVLAEVYIKSMRVMDGLIHPPSTPAKFRTFPAVFLSPPLAGALYDKISGSESLRERFPEHFPMMNREVCVAALGFPATDYVRDFPKLAVHLGLMGK